FSQVIDAPSAFTGQLSFFAEQRGYGGTQSFSVLLDGVPLRFGGSTVLTAPSTTSFTRFTSDALSVSPGPHTLSFEGLNVVGDNTAFIDAVSITRGTATLKNFSGGGLANVLGTLTVTDCTVSGNSAGDNGGGLYNLNGTLTLTNCTVSGNSAGYDGGGLWNNGTATLTDCTVSGNSAGNDGGGLFNGV